MRRSASSEKYLVAILFVTVLIVFSFAQEDTKNMEKIYLNDHSSATSQSVETNKSDVKKQDVILPTALR